MQAYTSPRRSKGFRRDQQIIWSLGVVVIAAILLIGFFYNRHEIKVVADGKTTPVIMRGGSVSDAIKKAQVKLGPKDIITPPAATELTKDQQVMISRRINITVIADGQTNDYWVPIGTVNQTLKNLKVSLSSGDKLSLESNKLLASGDRVEVTRISEHYITQMIKTPFVVEKRNDRSMYRGQTKIISAGKNGAIQKTIKITLKNGKEVKREVIGQKIISQPVNKVVALGTVTAKVISRGSKPIRFSRVLKMEASAYTYSGFRTASGVSPYRGAVAVDPDVIPLGSKLYIEGYGYAKALDVGSAIQGNKIDLFLESTRQALNWGRRHVTVYVLE